MSTIRIHIKNDEDPLKSLARVSSIIRAGFMSEGKHGPQYSSLTQMGDDVLVVAARNRSGHSFYVLPVAGREGT